MSGPDVVIEPFFQNSNDLLCVVDADSYFLRVNKAFASALGYKGDALEGQSFFDLIHSEDRDHALGEAARLQRVEDTVDFESRYLAQYGSWKWLAWSCPAAPPGSRLLYAMQQQTDEALSIRNFVFASMQHGLLITDPRLPDNPIVYSNPAFEDLTGYPLSAILGKNCRFLQNDDKDQKPMATLRGAIRDGVFCRVLLRNYRKDGTLFWNELTISPVHDSSGQLTHFVGIQNDVTDLVQSIAEDTKNLAARIEALAPRQKQVLDGLVSGLNIKQVAIDLGISAKIAEMHRTKLLQKMQVDDTLELFRTVLSSLPSRYYS